jgi:hypothetical protein
VANWITEELEKNKPETVKIYISALRNHHLEKGYSSEALDDPRISRIIRGSLRIQGFKPIRKRLEITREILLAIISTLTHDHDDTNLRAAFCVAFAAFLRPSEFTWETWDGTSSLTHISRQSITFAPEGALLYLPKSKTDQFRQGHTIALAYSHDEVCPVMALRTLFTKYPKPDSDPLFTKLIGQFNKRWLAQSLSKCLRKAGYDPTHYTGHSFRRGAASTALEAGVSHDDIKMLGRWKSDAVNKYFSDQSRMKAQFDVNRKLHLAPSGRKSSLILRTPKPAVRRNASIFVQNTGPSREVAR